MGATPGLGYGTAPTADGHWLIVALPSVHQVGVIDLSTMKVAHTIDVPAKPQEVIVSPDSQVAYVSCDQSGKVAVISLSDWKVKQIIDAGAGADGLVYEQYVLMSCRRICFTEPSFDRPSTDKRKQMALAGFIAGGGLPIGVMLLVGLMDSRYRYSDEPGGDMSGITLLGILPNLPDRLSDPGQAAIAAHCVHQIRTMLQINGRSWEPRHNSDEEGTAALRVTIATRGDGKTSLSAGPGPELRRLRTVHAPGRLRPGRRRADQPAWK